MEEKKQNKNIFLLVFLAVIVIVALILFLTKNVEAPIDTEPSQEDVVSDVQNNEDSGEMQFEDPLPPTEEEEDEDVQTQIIEVNYTEQGFSPSSIEINSGERVRFVNQSGRAMWVASDPHPTHSAYPQFDQRRAGNEFEFTFEREGSWGYHNHLNPSSGGTVIVR